MMVENQADLLETTFQFLSLCGVCPNSLHEDFVPWTRKVLTGLLGIYPTYFIIRGFFYVYNDYQDITAFVLVLGVAVDWITLLTATIMPIRNAPALVKFFKIVEQAQETLSSLDIPQPPVPSKLAQQIYITFLGIFLVFSALMVVPTNTFYTISSVSVLIAVNLATLVKMKMMLVLLDNKFNILNNCFKEVSDKTMGFTPLADFDVDDFIAKLHNTKFVKPKAEGGGITVDKILKFNKAHFQLCDAHNVLSSIFSLTSLIMTLDISFVFIKIFTAKDDNFVWTILLLHIGYGLTYMIMFISVLASATNVKNNALKTGFLVHELLNEELPPDVEEELQLFSHILIHRKIAIPAEGFFIIDLKLLTKMACTLAPLILILVQRKNRTKRAMVKE